MRNNFLILFTSFVVGVLMYHTGNYYLFSAVFAALFLIYFVNGKHSFCLFTLIFFLLGTATALTHRIIFNDKLSAISEGQKLDGYIVEKSDGFLSIKNYKKGYLINAYLDGDADVRVGDNIIFSYEVRKNPLYKIRNLNSRRINAVIEIKAEGASVTGSKSLSMLPYILKNKMNSELLSIDKAGGAFIAGLLSGYDNELSFEDKNNFDSLGISHILAVSGFNLGIIYMFTKRILGKLNARLRYSLILCICFFYSALTGFEPSIFRAFVMIAVLITAKLLNRSYDTLHGITLSALIMLLYNSYYIFNIGFLLSYAATYGIIMFKNEICDRLPQIFRAVKDEASVGIAAFLTTFPAVVWYKGYVSVITILINILVSPLIAFLTLLGFGVSLLYTILGTGILFYPVTFMGRLFLYLVDFVSKLNVQLYTGQPGIVFIIVYYLFILIIFGYIDISRLKVNKKIVYSVCMAVICITLFYRGRELKVHFINVGQGDSIFIETPDGHAILIDTGPEYKNYISSRDKVLPYIRRKGYNRIDVLLITHFHMDHAGGLDYLFDNVEIDNFIVHEVPKKNYKSSICVSKGDVIEIGDVNMEVLLPSEAEDNMEDRNENCIVLKLVYKDFTMLLTADAESRDLESLYGNYDIFKVSHHGSSISFSDKMILNSNIGAAIISVGKNSFGHPSGEVIRKLEDRGIEVYRTDMNGDISVISNGESYIVNPYDD